MTITAATRFTLSIVVNMPPMTASTTEMTAWPPISCRRVRHVHLFFGRVRHTDLGHRLISMGLNGRISWPQIARKRAADRTGALGEIEGLQRGQLDRTTIEFISCDVWFGSKPALPRRAAGVGLLMQTGTGCVIRQLDPQQRTWSGCASKSQLCQLQTWTTIHSGRPALRIPAIR